MLVDLLSDDGRHLYADLVGAGGRPLDELRERSAALQELIVHGLVWELPGPSPRVFAVSPVVAMRRLLNQEQRQVARAQRRLAERYAELELLEQHYPTELAEQTANIRVLPDAEAVMTAAHDLMTAARRQCHGVYGYPLGLLARTDVPASVSQRRLISPAHLEDAESRETVEIAAAGGMAFAVLPDLPSPMLVTESAALVRLTGDASLLIRDEGLRDSLDRLFDLLWRRALPVPDAAGPLPMEAPSAAQQQILRLAAAGLKDEAIARSLGRSVRWVRRHFELLEEMLGATNRMTLGITAARRGWV